MSIDLKNRVLMAYKKAPYISTDNKYYTYESAWYLIILLPLVVIYNYASPILGVILMLTLPIENLSINIALSFTLVLLGAFFIQFFTYFVTPIKDITKEEYEKELEELEQKEKEKANIKKNKKSFFQRYKEYKIKTKV